MFADDLVLLFFTESGLQLALNDFAATCDNAEMKINTTKTRDVEAVKFLWKRKHFEERS